MLLDFNHPLAGETLYFRVKIAALCAATPEELAELRWLYQRRSEIAAHRAALEKYTALQDDRANSGQRLALEYGLARQHTGSVVEATASYGGRIRRLSY